MELPRSNIILNHDFACGLQSWHSNCCDAFVSNGSNYAEEIKIESGSQFAVVSNRTESWQGLEQDITSRILPNITYTVIALVSIHGSTKVTDKVLATLKLEDFSSSASFLHIASTIVSNKQWAELEGSFNLKNLPKKATFYLEGPSSGIDLLISRVNISSESSHKEEAYERTFDVTQNIIKNPRFNLGLHGWNANSGDAAVHIANNDNGAQDSWPYAVVTNRKDSWHGLEQDITFQLKPNVQYKVQADVCVEGPKQSLQKVLATLRLEDQNKSQNFLCIARIDVEVGKWEQIGGTFALDEIPMKTIFYLEGPPAEFNLLVKCVEICEVSNSRFSPCDERKKIIPKNILKEDAITCLKAGDDNVIQNSQFEDGLNYWSGRYCKLVLRDATVGEPLPSGGKHYVIATNRTQTWNGIQQDITGRIQRKSAYEVMALVRIFGRAESADILATLYIQTKDLREQYITMGRVQASSKEWVQLTGRFLMNSEPSKAVAYLEGPSPGIDILVCSFSIYKWKRPPPSPVPIVENPCYGVNILENSDLLEGVKGWFPLGPCTINVAKGSPHIIPPTAQESLGCLQSLSGSYILATNRTQTWQGPAQMITDKLKLFVTYQVSAWVRVSSVKNGVQNVNVAISVDDQWNNGGEVEADEHAWREVVGSIRLEKRPSKVMLYVQGPSPGVDLMVAGLQIFAVDRAARFVYLKEQTEKLRMRDVIIKISGSGCKWFLPMKVTQISRSFPLGSCINRSSLDNEDFVEFFVKHFNWAVFGNELKWPWIEPQRGQYNYRDADELLDFCNRYDIKVRGHCIFWEVIYFVQQWVQALNQTELKAAIQNRLFTLLSRYRGKFQHYDVNNEMLHGSFYQQRLGKNIWYYMFKTAHQLDPSALLFVNDYHIEDGNEARSSPEKYIGQIVDLQANDAPVGGIGIQGHITYPIGSIVHSALDKLASLGLPIWFTEVDVISSNEYIRADDLEVMLREIFAHPAVEGIMLWGFWDLTMSREQAHLVEADGTLNAAGRRFLCLKEEWSTNLCGHSDLEGCFKFKAFHGTYDVEVATFEEIVKHRFVVDKGDSPLVIEIKL